MLGGKLFEFREGDLWLLAEGALQADGDLGGDRGGVAEQTLLDIADLLNVNVAEGDTTGFALDVCDLD